LVEAARKSFSAARCVSFGRTTFSIRSMRHCAKPAEPGLQSAPKPRPIMPGPIIVPGPIHPPPGPNGWAAATLETTHRASEATAKVLASRFMMFS
jgi:hypothetical protein